MVNINKHLNMNHVRRTWEITNLILFTIQMINHVNIIYQKLRVCQMKIISVYIKGKCFAQNVTWILGNMTRNARHELPKTLDFTDWLPIST